MKRHLAAALAVALPLTGCRTYQPRPLQLDEYAASWADRAIDIEPVRTVAQRLNGGDAAQAGFDPADGLSLREAEAVALYFNPDLRQMRQDAEVERAGAEFAGLWDDPELEADLLRFADDVDEPWIAGAGIGFTLPLSGRLPVERDVAWAGYEVAWREVVVEELRLVATLRETWLEWSAAAAEVEAVDAYLERLDAIIGITEQLVRAGEITPVEARVIRIDRAVVAAEQSRLAATADERKLEVLRLLGLRPWADVALVPAVTLADADARLHGVDDPDATILAHPEVALARARYERAEARLHREVRKQYPDLAFGPVYEYEEGQSRIGVGLGLPIPVLNANRRGIAEAEAQREAARVQAEAAYEGLAHRVAGAQARFDAAESRLAVLQREVVPLVEEQIAAVRELIELGELEVLVLEDALSRLLETRRQIVAAHRDRAVALSDLRALLAPQWTFRPAQRRDGDHDDDDA